MINWKVRFKSKTFWVTFIPAMFMLVQVVLSVFGISADFDELQGKILAVVDAVFVLLSIMGVVVDHTTLGVSDSAIAMTYEEPKGDEY